MNSLITSILPFLGTALGGPLGGAAASFIGDKLGLSGTTVDTVKGILTGMPPEKLADLKVVEQEFQLHMAALGYDSVDKLEEFNTRNTEAINNTMQAEATSDHWPSYSWRPFIGFTFGLYVCSLWMLPLCGKQPVIMDPSIVLAIGGILGVASYFRGKAQADPTVQITTKG